MKSNLLNLTLIQPNIYWEDVEKNLKHLDILIDKDNSRPDIILLPEMFTTGFSMNVKHLAEGINGKTSEWMFSKARLKNAAIAGSLIFLIDGKYYNRLIWVDPDGKTFHYNKRHLFSIGNEDKYFERGDERLIINYKGWRICPLICYDLRFPVWSRNRNDYDLLIYAANWPAARNRVWDILLHARAIENQCYVAGVNRVGTDGEDIQYTGKSCVINPKGQTLAIINKPREGILNACLDLKDLQDFRKKFPVYKDSD